jgi:iron complex outermembrane receptor protein
VPVGAVQVEDCDGDLFISGATANLKCLPLQYLSPNIVNVYGRYNFTPNMSLFVSYSWSDDQHTEALNLEKNQPGEKLESYKLVNATFDWKGINDSNIDLSIFATNLLDEEYRISNTDVYQAGSLGAWATLYGEPRIFGARLRYNWGG